MPGLRRAAWRFVAHLTCRAKCLCPGQINVAVQGIEGDEVSLGSLASFLVLLLGELNIPLYPALDANTESIKPPRRRKKSNRVLSSFIALAWCWQKNLAIYRGRRVVEADQYQFIQASACLL